MSGNPDPLSQVTGRNTALDVSKPQDYDYLLSDLHWFPDCNTVRNTDLSARTRIMAGNRFFRKDTSDVSADDGTETSLVVIDGAGIHWLVIEGERYDIPFSSTGFLGDGEALPAIAIVTPLTIPAALPGSTAFAVDGVPTSDFTVIFKKSLDFGVSWTTAFTMTILAGERVGTFTLVADLSLPANSLLRPYMPSPHDPTFEGFTSTIAALR